LSYDPKFEAKYIILQMAFPMILQYVQPYKYYLHYL